MIRKIGFASLLVTAFIVAACGRQVTPNPPNLGAGGAPPGFVSITFDVAGQMNFSSYSYWVVFNTSGNGVTPGTNTLQTNWAGWSFAIEAGTGGVSGFSTSAAATEVCRGSTPQVPPNFQYLGTTPTLLQYNPNSDGTGGEFTVIFSRKIFSGICATTAGRAASRVVAAPAPDSSPQATNWRFNAFTTSGNPLSFVDSLGAGGPTFPQYVSPAFNINQCVELPITATFTGTQIDPNADITNLTLANNPSPGPSSSPCSSSSSGD